jgi:hypothetical protein
MLSVIPATSVDCERGFSNLSRIKTYMRSRLQNDHLEPLIRVSTTSISTLELVKLHADTLIRMWKSHRQRRAVANVDKLLDEPLEYFM